MPRGESAELGTKPGIMVAASARNIAMKARKRHTSPMLLWRQSVTVVRESKTVRPGTDVDVGILVVGLAVSAYRVRQRTALK